MLKNKYEFGIVRDDKGKPIYDGFRYETFYGCGCKFFNFGYFYFTILSKVCSEYAKEEKEMEFKDKDNASS